MRSLTLFLFIGCEGYTVLSVMQAVSLLPLYIMQDVHLLFPGVSLLSIFYSTFYKLRTKFQNVSLLVFETQAFRNVAVDLCILKPHGNWKHELLSLSAV